MLYVKLNDGRTENLMHISHIDIDGNDVIYYSAKGSLDGYREHFETKQAAQDRFDELKKDLLAD